MGMKPNQRVMLTKELIHRAFLKLLSKDSIHKIAIRELCQEAGINRTTFYNHYGSQYDVLAEITDNYLSDISAVIEKAKLHDRESVYNRVTLVLRYMEDNLELSRLLIKNNIDETFAERLFSLPKIGDLLNEALATVDDWQDQQAVMQFTIYGSYKLLQEWLTSSNRIPAELEAARILTLAGRVCNWE